MQHQQRRLTSQGFTIVETMFVLAIAGVIMVSTLLAIPAVQRNSRNSLKRTEITALLSLVARYKSDHLGAMPAQCDGGTVPNCAGIDMTGEARLLNGREFKSFSDGAVGIYPYSVRPAVASITSLTGPNFTEYVQVHNWYRCDYLNGVSAVTQGAARRDVVALFYVETSNGHALQCQQL